MTKKIEVVSLNIGVTLMTKQGDKIRKFTLAGLAPSPAHLTTESLVNAIQKFVQEHTQPKKKKGK